MSKQKQNQVYGQMVVGVLAIAVLVLAAACGPAGLLPSGSSGSSSGGSSGKSSSSSKQPTARVTPRPTVAPIERKLEGTPLALFKYADLEFTATEGLITNEEPGGKKRYSRVAATLELKLKVVNPTRNFARIDAGLLRLELGSGESYEEPLSGGFEARDTQEFEFRWQVPVTATWEGAKLTLDELDKEPVSARLDTQEKPRYPVELVAENGKSEVSVEAPAKLAYRLSEGKVDLDALGRRVEKGKVYVVLTIAVKSSEEAYDAYAGPESFRLLVDGAPMKAETLDPAAEAVRPGSEVEFRLVFVVPAEAQKLVLEVGEAGKATATIPLALKEAKE